MNFCYLNVRNCMRIQHGHPIGSRCHHLFGEEQKVKKDKKKKRERWVTVPFSFLSSFFCFLSACGCVHVGNIYLYKRK
jgi:hypothetical protein